MKPYLRATSHSRASLSVVPLSILVIYQSGSVDSSVHVATVTVVWLLLLLLLVVGPLSPVTHKEKGKGRVSCLVHNMLYCS